MLSQIAHYFFGTVIFAVLGFFLPQVGAWLWLTTHPHTESEP